MHALCINEKENIYNNKKKSRVRRIFYTFARVLFLSLTILHKHTHTQTRLRHRDSVSVSLIQNKIVAQALARHTHA